MGRLGLKRGGKFKHMFESQRGCLVGEEGPGFEGRPVRKPGDSPLHKKLLLNHAVIVQVEREVVGDLALRELVEER